MTLLGCICLHHRLDAVFDSAGVFSGVASIIRPEPEGIVGGEGEGEETGVANITRAFNGVRPVAAEDETVAATPATEPTAAKRASGEADTTATTHDQTKPTNLDSPPQNDLNEKSEDKPAAESPHGNARDARHENEGSHKQNCRRSSLHSAVLAFTPARPAHHETPSLAAAFIAATSLLATTSARNAKKSHTHHHTPDTTKSNATAETRETSHKAYWYTQMDHTGAARGIAPYAPGGEKWEVYVAAKTNDTQSIFDAIEKGGREKEWIVSNPRVVYVPPGTYEFDRELWCHIDTIIVGDPRDMPVFKPAGNFSKKAKFFIHGRDKDVGEQGENSFAVGLKNVIIDLTDFQSNQQLTALDWSVAQAAQLTNIHIKLRNYNGRGKDKGQIGIQQRRGSTLALSDITIEGGAIGIWQNGHQQMLYKGITFLRNRIGLQIDGGNAVVLLGCTFNTVGTSISHTSGTPGVTAVDCRSVDSGVFFKSSGGEVPSIAIESLDLDRVNEDVVQLPLVEYTLGPTKRVDTFTYGNTVDKETESGATYGASKATRERPQAVAPD
ncbi:hypothetical protein KEM55_003012, partial [Ascosphaera atra]